MTHQSLVTRPAVPSATVPPESHPKPDVLDIFGSQRKCGSGSLSARSQSLCASDDCHFRGLSVFTHG